MKLFLPLKNYYKTYCSRVASSLNMLTKLATWQNGYNKFSNSGVNTLDSVNIIRELNDLQRLDRQKVCIDVVKKECDVVFLTDSSNIIYGLFFKNSDIDDYFMPYSYLAKYNSGTANDNYQFSAAPTNVQLGTISCTPLMKVKMTNQNFGVDAIHGAPSIIEERYSTFSTSDLTCIKFDGIEAWSDYLPQMFLVGTLMTNAPFDDSTPATFIPLNNDAGSGLAFKYQQTGVMDITNPKLDLAIINSSTANYDSIYSTFGVIETTEQVILPVPIVLT